MYKLTYVHSHRIRQQASFLKSSLFFLLFIFIYQKKSTKTLLEMHNNPFFYRQGHPACVGTLVSGVLISGILVLGN